ncbi:putative ribonuclease H-like domain-containing protein [Tanacetum coccineum]
MTLHVSLRPDIMFAVCAYITPYSDYVGASLDRKATTGGCQFLGCRLISWQCKKQTVVANSTTEAEYVAASSCYRQVIPKVNAGSRHNITALGNIKVARNKLTAAVKSKNWQWGSTVTSQLDGRKDNRYCEHLLDLQNAKKFNFQSIVIESMVKEFGIMQSKCFGMYPRIKRKDTKISQSSGPTDNVADKAVYKEKDDSLVRFATTATGFYAEVLDLENTRIDQAQEITSLKLRVKKLEKKKGSRTHKLKRLYKVGRSARMISSDEASLGDQEDASKQGRKIDDIDKDVEITLVDETQGRYGDEEMFDTCVHDGDEVLAETEVTVKDVNLSVDEVTLAQALAALKTVSTRPKAKGLVIHEEEQATTPIVSSQQPSQGVKERIEMEKAKANIALKETWDDIQAKIERKEENSLQQNDQKRRGIDHQPELNKGKLFDKAMKMVNTFVDMDTELVKGIEVRAKGSETRAEGSSKRAGEDLQQESTKKQKVDDDKESGELKKCLEDLEVLWSIVKARFKKTEPVNYMDSFLLLNLKTMFEDNGRIVGIKSLHDDLGVTTAQVRVTAAKQNLVLLINSNEKYAK